MKHKRLIALIGLALLLAACGASFAQRAGMTAAAIELKGPATA